MHILSQQLIPNKSRLLGNFGFIQSMECGNSGEQIVIFMAWAYIGWVGSKWALRNGHNFNSDYLMPTYFPPILQICRRVQLHLLHLLLSRRKMQKNFPQTCYLLVVNMLSTSLGRRVSYFNVSSNPNLFKIINDKKIRIILGGKQKFPELLKKLFKVFVFFLYGSTTPLQSFGLLNQLFPSSSILGKGLPVWYFYLF